MARLRLTEACQADIAKALAWSQLHFGEGARRRYESLITAALLDIADDPLRPGGMDRPELGPAVRIWHLRGSRPRAGQGSAVVGRPRHFLIYRHDRNWVVAGRLLHDAMHIERHLSTSDWA